MKGILLRGTDRLHTELTTKRGGYAYKANAIFNEMISDILRIGGVAEIEREEQKRRMFAVELLQNVTAFIEEHYCESVYLEDVARYCNLSKFYFSHLFKSITASTFHEYITRFRLEMALQPLATTEKKIVEITLDCGFTGSRAFNREFSRVFRQTPSEYRKAPRTSADA